jgi:hypothetical protein
LGFTKEEQLKIKMNKALTISTALAFANRFANAYSINGHMIGKYSDKIALSVYFDLPK